MYAVLVTCNALAPPNIGLPASRGSTLFGLRFIALPAQGETVQQAYQGLSIITRQITNNPAAGSYNDQSGKFPYLTDQIPIVDDSMMMMCRPEAIQLNGPTGQEVLVYIPEGQAEVIYPSSYGAINSGGNNPGAVAITTQVTATGYTPTTAADGASIAGAKGAFVWALPGGGGTWADGELFNVWRSVLGGTAWLRCPGNDVPVPTGSAALGASKPIGLPDFTFAAGPPSERWAVIASAAAIVGGAAVGTTYEVQA